MKNTITTDIMIAEALVNPASLQYWSTPAIQMLAELVRFRRNDAFLTHADDCARLWTAAINQHAHRIAADLARGDRPDPKVVDQLLGAVELLGGIDPRAVWGWIERLAESKSAQKAAA